MSHWSSQNVSSLKGVGPAVAEKLAQLGIHNQLQLLFHLPIRYEDRTRVLAIAALQPGSRALIEGEIIQSGVSFRTTGRHRRVLLVKLADGTGLITLRFFNFSFQLQQKLSQGMKLRCFGEPRWIAGSIEMAHPELEFIGDNPTQLATTLTPVYPVTEGLKQKGIRKIIEPLLKKLNDDPPPETLPDTWLASQQLPDIAAALQVLHQPVDSTAVQQIESYRHPAQRRFIVEELAAHRIQKMRLRQKFQQQAAINVSAENRLAKRLLEQLPFSLTSAQQRVIGEIQQDFGNSAPMLRLLQGDVGSGKTIVAALVALQVIEAGFQVAMMAPTEILVQQHAQTLQHWLQPLGVSVLQLTSSDKGQVRQQKEMQISSREAALIVGTHALFQQSVQFAALGLVIIDEQHRFGVAQRRALRDKAGDRAPHQLVMTATPIPRTLAMSVYADLDYSQIDELPPGRKPVTTSVIGQSSRPRLIERIRAACSEGQQVYWVCTLIEESEALQCEAAEQTFEQLGEQLPDFSLGLVHGRMTADEKHCVLTQFKNRQIQLLVATTVIEVGVDVPNASIMIIENPERLGLSQIHQLRGRVGRGERESFCLLLVGERLSSLAKKRLEVLREHQDGFVIAEKDLQIRGAGDYLGTRQAGEARFKMADLLRDRDCFDQVKTLANQLMQEHYEPYAERLLENWIGQRAEYAEIA